MRATLALVLMLVASPALAFQCPSDMAAIDATLETAALSQSELAQVKELRARGQELHETGQHQESIDTLSEAKTILGI